VGWEEAGHGGAVVAENGDALLDDGPAGSQGRKRTLSKMNVFDWVVTVALGLVMSSCGVPSEASSPNIRMSVPPSTRPTTRTDVTT
jgi:hypothetical protein